MSQRFGRFTMNPFKWVLLLLSVGFFAVIVWRTAVGLGAVTNLSDTAPWGTWKVWDVIAYIPLGASGFTLAFVRYIVKDERYEQIARRAVMWAIIAYASSGLRLMFDIGVPWRLPMPLLFSRNIHSALLEVAWCMFLYLIVLLMENAPRLMERFHQDWIVKAEHVLHKILPIFVLGGVLLSLMHQSTLGTIFMVMGKRVDPLWYHPWLNYLFLLTAIAGGLGVSIVIEALMHRYYKVKFETALLSKMGVAMLVALVVAFVWRIGAMAAAGSLGNAFAMRGAVLSWWVEIITLFVVPIILLANSAWRSSRRHLTMAAASTVFGMLLYRLNVGFPGIAATMKSTYVPTFPELLFSVGGTALTILLFLFAAEKLPGVLGKDTPAHAEETADVAEAIAD